MITLERINLVAPCGIDCGLCELYVCGDNPQLKAYLVEKGIPQEKLPCSRCREIKGICPVIGSQCATYACVTDRNVGFCFQCRDFPCMKLHPSADRADVLPHNLKIYNLITIQRDGVEAFIETSAETRRRYYKGKMKIGNGPQV